MKNRPVIFVTENYVSGGANKYAEDVINSLEGHYENLYILGNPEAITAFNKSRIPSRAIYKAITIFNTGEKVKKYKRPLRLGLMLLLFPVSLLVNFFSYLNLSIFIFSKNPDRVILCNGGYPASSYLIFSLLFIGRKHNPVMTIVSTPTTSKNLFLKKIWKRVDRMVQKNTHMIAVNSDAIKKEMIEKLDFSPNAITIIRNGVEDLKIKREMKSDKIVIGYVSRIEATKGIRELLKAYSNLSSKFKNLELIIVGNGSLDEMVKKEAQKNSSIKVLGHISGDLSHIFKQIDIFTLPSYQEGLPYSVIEACMASCAIVATFVGGIPEIIANEKSGLLVPPQDAIALENALFEVITNPELRKSYAIEARNSYEAHFTFAKMKEQSQIILR